MNDWRHNLLLLGGALDDSFDIADCLLRLARDLFAKSLGLLLFASYQLARFLLDSSNQFVGGTIDLLLVHAECSLKVE